jgi:hypothetical protein
MLIPLGILASSGGAAGSYELIETVTVGAGGAASVTFSSLNTYNTTYQHLQLRMVVRQSHTSNDLDLVTLQFNSDTGSNYARHRLWGSGSSVASYAASSGTYGYAGLITRSTGSVNASSVCDILDPFETTKNTTIRALAGGTNSAQNVITLMSSLWNSTSAVTSITLKPEDTGYNFAQYSRFSLYGLRGA